MNSNDQRRDEKLFKYLKNEFTPLRSPKDLLIFLTQNVEINQFTVDELIRFINSSRNEKFFLYVINYLIVHFKHYNETKKLLIKEESKKNIGKKFLS